MDRVSSLIDSIPHRFERKEIVPFVSIAAAATLLYSTYKLLKYNNRHHGLKDIPSPSGAYPYVGHMLSVGDKPSLKITEWHKEVGNIMKLRMGVQTWVLINDPELAHKVFVTHGADSSYRPHGAFTNIYSHNGRGIVFSPPEKHWKDARSAVVSILSPKYVDTNYMVPIKKQAYDLTERLIRYSIEGNGVDPYIHAHLYSMNTIYMSAFGKQFDSVEDEEFLILSASIVKSIDLAGIDRDLSTFLPIFSIVEYFTGKTKTMKDFVAIERDPVYQKFIDEALTKTEPNFVKELGKYEFDTKSKLVILSDLIAAGTDTVSVSLTWIFAIVCNHPTAQSKAVAEIDEFIKLNGRLPLFSERESISYCISLVKECMRFKPTTSLGIPHKASKDIIVDGYLIPKGATIMTNMESIHANPEVYPDPETFYPERFIDNIQRMDNAVKGKLENRDHFGFGWGRRVCPGTYMAEAEILTAFIQVLSRCSIEPVIDSNGKERYPNTDHSNNSGLSLTPSPYKIKFVERTKTNT